MNLIKSTIGLTNGKKFTVYHDLTENRLQEITQAWLQETTSYNVKSLVACICSMGRKAYTEKQFKRQGISSRKK